MSDETYTHETWLSPLSWRYGTPPMRALWSEAHKRRLWRRIWVALAETQAEVGLVKPEQVEDLRAHQDEVDIVEAHRREAELHHDLMAEVHTYAAQCGIGGGIIHLGATSMDVEDNADAMRLRDALDLLRVQLRQVCGALAVRVREEASTTAMAFTHLQPAEPTTVGYRLAQHGQDLLVDLEDLDRLRDELKGKGFKGAVGTCASYGQLLEGTGWTPAQLEAGVMGRLDLPAFEAATQTAPRKQEYRILSGIASLGQTLYKLAADLRLLQSPPLGEWAEPFGKKQIGSSAMPFKRNPIVAENMDSQARHLAALPRVAWDNAAHSYLERTLDDSANRRSVLAEACLIADDLLKRALRLVRDGTVVHVAVARNLEAYGPFAASERVLMQTARRGADRQEMHEVIREGSLTAWAAIQDGSPNPLADTLASDDRVLAWATADEVHGWMDASDYVGDAPERAVRIADALAAAGEAA